MGQDYAKVLQAQRQPFTAICRSPSSAKAFKESTEVDAIHGGLEHYLEGNPNRHPAAIVATGILQLAETTQQLIQAGVKRILVEKPAGASKEEVESIRDAALQHDALVYTAYNRRFYASVSKARELIVEDGGVISFHFEFTEWSHLLEKEDIDPSIKKIWFLANSTHVCDLAFHLGGNPKELNVQTDSGLAWHPASSVFSGSGSTDSGALFSYFANWQAPGRWSLEILTQKRRLIFRPMEELQLQEIGSVAILPLKDISYEKDKSFKPGLHAQVRAFIDRDDRYLCSISNQLEMLDVYYKMANY